MKRRFAILGLAAIAVVGCADGFSDEEPAGAAENQPSSSSEGDSSGGAEASDFVVHGWGAFTSLVDSEGTYRTGLHHRDASLPPFVHKLGYRGVDRERLHDGAPYLPEPVVQRLETPMLYFYSDEPRDVTVSVDFPDGYISKWYPGAAERTPSSLSECCESDEDPERRALDALADGSVNWEVSVTDTRRSPVDVPSNEVWAPARDVPEAAWVTRGEEAEKFLFHRGVGRFELPLTVEVDEVGATHEIQVTNASDQPVEHVYLLDVHEDNGRIVDLSEVPADGERTFMPAPKESPIPTEQLRRKAASKLTDSLVDEGLTDGEAEAMVDIWSQSYFADRGYRLLYVLPGAWTDDRLPTEIEPTPEEFERVLVGRVEMLTPRAERRAVERVVDAYRNDRSLTEIAHLDRFEEPRFRRACELVDDTDIRNWCEAEVRDLQTRTLRFDSR